MAASKLKWQRAGPLCLFFKAFAAGVAAVPPPSPDATPFKFWPWLSPVLVTFVVPPPWIVVRQVNAMY